MVAFKPKQSLGQNFLVDDNIARNIVRDMHLSRGDVVIEIGPGQGALTKHLAAKVDALLAVEIDTRVIDGLRKALPSSNVVILNEDFLELDLAAIHAGNKKKLRRAGHI